jgi:hypothetical protein
MNERERWIIYPLLFFALGAALRDKFLQRVETKDLASHQVVAKEVVCQTLSILDPDEDDRIVAQLTSRALPAAGGADGNNRFGVLLLYDNQGKELCGVTNQELFVRQINCLGVNVIDPENAGRTLAALASAEIQSSAPGAVPGRTGVLLLNNREYGRLVGVPPANPAVQQPPSSPAPPESSSSGPPSTEPGDAGASAPAE